MTDTMTEFVILFGIWLAAFGVLLLVGRLTGKHWEKYSSDAREIRDFFNENQRRPPCEK